MQKFDTSFKPLSIHPKKCFWMVCNEGESSFGTFLEEDELLLRDQGLVILEKDFFFALTT